MDGDSSPVLHEEEGLQTTEQHIELTPQDSDPPPRGDAQPKLEHDETDMIQCVGRCSGVSYSWNPAEIRVSCCGREWLRFNWMVMGISVSIIWSFIIWSIADPKAGVDIGEWQVWIVHNFAWFYAFCMAMFMGFMLYVAFSEWGDIRLAASDDEEPDFSYATWFSMLFSAGVAIGIFLFGVGEPIDHFNGAIRGTNRWANLPLNEKAIAALNLTWFHWGFSASSVYAIVGLPLAFFAHRKKMPMTIRTTFYALLGNDVYGPIGDVLDSLAVIGTMFGVATSLGFGIIQLNTGFHRVVPTVKDDLSSKLIIMWCVTGVATISVMTGLKVGIRRLSEVNFMLGNFIVFYLFFVANSVFQLDIFVETIGYHIQWLPKLLLKTDAFERNGFNAANYPQQYTGINTTDGAGWMGGWSTFYWAWWIAWSPFVGLFIASISKGRTIREFIIGNMIVPTFMTCVIFTVFGGIALDIEMKSYLAGYDCGSTVGVVLGPNGETNIPKNLVRLSCRAMSDRFFDVLDAYPLSNFMGFVSIVTMTTYFVTSSDSASHVIDVITSNGYHEPPMIQRVFWALMEGAAASALLVAGGTNSLGALQTASLAAGLPFTFVLVGMMFSTKKALTEEMLLIKSQQADAIAAPTEIKPPTAATFDEANKSDFEKNLLEVGGGQDDVAQNAQPLASRSDMYGTSQSAVAYERPFEAEDQMPVRLVPWSSSLCSVCWKRPVETLLAFVLPCGVQFKTQWDTERYEDYVRGQICLGIQLFLPFILVIVFAGVGTVNSGFYAFSSICALTFYVLSVKYRMNLRELYGVEGGLLGDMGAYCCCYGCAIAQEYDMVQVSVGAEAGDAKGDKRTGYI